MKHCWKILLLLTLLPFGLYSQTFQVKVIGIADGDTFTGLNSDNLQLKFRIHGIDAPEKKQTFGTKAREHLGSLIFKQNVTVDVSDRATSPPCTGVMATTGVASASATVSARSGSGRATAPV